MREDPHTSPWDQEHELYFAGTLVGSMLLLTAVLYVFARSFGPSAEERRATRRGRSIASQGLLDPRTAPSESEIWSDLEKAETRGAVLWRRASKRILTLQAAIRLWKGHAA